MSDEKRSDDERSDEKRSIYREPEAPQPDFATTTLALGVGGFLLFMTLLFWVVETVGLKELQVMIAGAGLWGPLLFVGLKALTFTFAPLSAGPIQFASGILFGVIPGTFYSLLGEVIGGSINVIIARLLGRRIVQKFVGFAALQRIDSFYERHLDDWRSLFVARLLLFSVYDFISYAVGFGRIKLSVYILVSFAGGLVPTYLFVRIGTEAAQDQNLLLILYVGAAILFLVYLLFRRPLNELIEWLASKI